MFRGNGASSLGTGGVALLRGKGLGIELVFAGRELPDALEELAARLSERPGFYRGTSALLNFGTTPPGSDALAQIRALLDDAGIELRALTGSAEVESVASSHGLPFEPTGAPPELERRRALRPRGELHLSEAARSLVADFAGARADIAQRRRRGEASVPRLSVPLAEAAEAVPVAQAALPPQPGALYHVGTLRGGQALHHPGDVIVVGDVNPGAELVATGDIVVFGRLAGVAHAGAQGDESARVYALDLDATQLRIAALIAAETSRPAGAAREPEAALVAAGRIAVVPLGQLGQLLERGSLSS
jgi:septum site-determining protein MinC